MEAKKLPTAESVPFQLSLRIRHPSMDPADISRALKIEAEHSFRAGTPRSSSISAAAGAVYADSYWLGVLKSTGPLLDIAFPGDYRSHIAQKQLAATAGSLTWALALRASRVLGPHAELLRRIHSEGGDVTLLVTICSGEVSSFALLPETSRLFADLHIAVEFELAGEFELADE